ncbi:hypothetical protein DFJ74DRAFT_597079, partial [Hyaloraphidium curvatum]
LPVTALLDPGATGFFMDYDFCRRARLPFRRAPTPGTVRAVDGHAIHDGAVETLYETAPIPVVIGPHADRICFNLIRSPDQPVIIGMPYLKAKSVVPSPDW